MDDCNDSKDCSSRLRQALPRSASSAAATQLRYVPRREKDWYPANRVTYRSNSAPRLRHNATRSLVVSEAIDLRHLSQLGSDVRGRPLADHARMPPSSSTTLL